MSVSKTYMARAYELSLCTNTPKKVYTTMRRVTKTTIKLLKAIHVVDLLGILVKKGIPLTSVHNQCSNVCKQLGERKTYIMSKTIMKWKLEDARNELRKMKRNNTIMWRENHHVLKENGIEKEHFHIWKEEKCKQREALKKKKSKKVTFLINKYGKKDTPTETNEIEGIRISDRQLSENFESKPRCYGGIELTKEEEETLSLNPKFSIYGKEISVEETEAQIEKGLTKLRWSRMRDEEDHKEKKKNDANLIRHDKDGRCEETTNDDDEEERVWPLDLDCQKLDFRHLRPTDLKFNKRVYMPPPLRMEEEIKLQQLKNDLMNATKEYVEQKKKIPVDKRTNLTKNERVGLKSLMEREDIMIMQTDKSGRFSVDSKENYKQSCTPHVQNDLIVDENEHLQAQKEINAHSVFWVRILKAGESTKGKDRIKQNMLVENHSLAPLYTLRKDHKKDYDSIKGPPCRPVCGASTAYNNKLSNLISTILRPVWQEQPTICTSTEEMLATITETNKRKMEYGTTIGSADVKSLYPSLDICFTADKVGEMFLNSELEVEMDATELGLYLAINLKEEDLVEGGLSSFCHKRKTKTGRPPKLTGCALDKNLTNRFKPWNPPEKIPDKKERKRMMAEALKVIIKYIMKNHMYSFETDIRKQKEGGPIGLELTGDLAQIVMSWWDKELLKTLKEQTNIEILMYKRYIDDINIVMRSSEANTTGTEKNKTEEENIRKIQEVGNMIHPSIQLEVDYPSLHKDNKLPILDLKVWIEDRKILHEYYSKDIASRSVIHARSALPMGAKRVILTQEVLRIILNCSRELPWHVTSGHINNFIARMQYSGYQQIFREQVVKSALAAYRKLLAMEQEGKRPLYRPKEWKEKERAKERRRKKTNWFKGKGDETVIFIPATPNAELKKKFVNIIGKTEIKVKVVEHQGRSIAQLFQQHNKEKRGCGDRRCMVCRDDKGGPCRTQGVTYEIQCNKCKKIYIGETSRNGFTRGLEHQAALKDKSETSTLWKHICQNHHTDDSPTTFRMKITGIFKNDATLRQISEATKIKNTQESRLMNEKTEWNTTTIYKIKTMLMT